MSVVISDAWRQRFGGTARLYGEKALQLFADAHICVVGWRQRFGGTARLYGEKALQLFADAHICVVGIGGVGSWAAEALARTGIGAITLNHAYRYG